MTVHPGIIYFWVWMFVGAAYQREETAEAGRQSTDEQPLSDTPPLTRCGETCSTWQ